MPCFDTRHLYLNLRDQVRSFKYPKRDKMEALKEQWIQECGYTPVGNVKGSEWATASKDSQVGEEVVALLQSGKVLALARPGQLVLKSSQNLTHRH